jgi:hypothetical protein
MSREPKASSLWVRARDLAFAFINSEDASQWQEVGWPGKHWLRSLFAQSYSVCDDDIADKC